MHNSLAADLRADIAYARRGLSRSPAFTAAAVLTLGLGIGAATAVFSVVHTVLLEPLPYKDSARLVRIVERSAPANPTAPLLRRTGMSWPEMIAWRKATTTLSEMALSITPPITLMPTSAGSVRLTGALVSANLFTMLGARARLGRILETTDESSGSNVVVISAGAWQRYFQGDPGILGRSITLKTLGPEAGFLDGTPLTIVGVMPAAFDYPLPNADYWAPITESSPIRKSFGGGVIAKLRDGTSLEAAADEANAIGDAVRPKPTSGPLSRPLPPGERRFAVEGIKEQMIASSRPALRVIAIAVAAVLLMVCANVGGLLLARGTARQREVAVRLAIGASRGRILRQFITESLVLASIGGMIGALLAVGFVYLLREFASPHAQGVFQLSFGGSMLPRLHEIGVDGRLLALAIALAMITALIVGALPAFRMSRVDHAHVMNYRGAGGQGGARRADTRARSVLAVAQMIVATMLLVGAGLLINSFNRLARVDPGWNASGLLTFYLVMPQDYSTARKAAVIDTLLTELRQQPDVRGVGYTYAGPLLGIVDTLGTFVPPGRSPDEMRGNPDNPHIRAVSHDYLQTIGARLVSGRWFTPGDDAAAPPVIIVNRTVVRRLFNNEDPVGRLVHLDGRMEFPPQQIVGVVDDMRQSRLDAEPAPQMFIDYRQMLALTQARKMPTAGQERLSFGFLSFFVRTDRDPATLMPAVRALVNRVDSAAGIDAMLPMEQLVASSLTRQRFYAMLLGLFAAIAAVLGAIGIYGVLAFAVAERTQEIGIRMALGAERGTVLRMVLQRGVVIATVGILFGLAGAAGLTRYLSGMLFDLTPLDPPTYAAVAILFATVALIASYLPARRAT
ncbi:MAG TPA: ABC transporter permease, partial [Vicinamibacterales bacterium]|nr:ABC transporter permease [Vicinamibacterales bacterium]